jgi:hypothetical protein
VLVLGAASAGDKEGGGTNKPVQKDSLTMRRKGSQKKTGKDDYGETAKCFSIVMFV